MRILLILLVTSAPFQALASDNSCLQKLKTLIIQAAYPAIEPATAAALGGIPDDFTGFPRQKERFERQVDPAIDRNSSELTYRYIRQSGDKTFDVEFEIAPASGYANDIYSLTRTVDVYTDMPSASLKTQWVITKDCGIAETSNTWISHATEKGRIRINYRKAEKGMQEKSFSQLVDEQLVRETQLMTSTHSFAEARAKGLVPGRKLHFMSEDEGSLRSGELLIQQVPPIRRYSPFTKRIESLEGMAFEIADVTYSYFGGADDRYDLYLIRLSGNAWYTESVPVEIWLKEDLDPQSHGDRVSGFAGNEDFTSPSLTFDLKAAKALTLHNAGAYFSKIKETENALRVTVEQVSQPPPAIAWDAPTADADKKYLGFSAYIQLEPVKAIADELRPKLAGKNRIEAAVLIAEKVNELIKYDYEALANNLIEVRPTAEVLKDKKGVCQHFAGVYVSIARALGIPSRPVVGYMLLEKSLNPHAWIEIKINESVWWPLEPQNTGFALPYRNYIPIGVYQVYEDKIHTDIQGHIRAQAELVKTFAGWDQVKAQKVSP